MLETFFPKLAESGYEVTSPKSDAYNCIAWAAGDAHHWWWPIPAEETFWPADVPRAATLEAFVAAFATLGYEGICSSADGSNFGLRDTTGVAGGLALPRLPLPHRQPALNRHG